MDEITLTEDTKLQTYKSICAKLGIIMCVYFVCRHIATLAIYYITEKSGSAIGPTLLYTVRSFILIALVYVIPICVTAILLNNISFHAKTPGWLQSLYKKPKRLAKNLGNFPAMYGFGQSINFLTILVFYLISVISRTVGNGVELERFFSPAVVETPHDLISAFIMVFMMVIIAPLLEEFWVRGLLYDALKTYGNGAAIIISSVMFGLMHGSINMLFYTTALGFALGYIRYATDSLFVVTILHLIINAVAAVMLFLLSLADIAGGDNQLINTLVNIYMLVILVMVILGLAAMIKKIPVMKKYRIANDWPDISAKKKMALFITSVPVIIMLILAFDTHANNLMLGKAIESLLR